jgi:aspartate aminotransferase
MKAQGIDVVNFGVGEPDFDTALKEGFTKYTPVGGTDDLKNAIIDKFRSDNGLSYEKSEVMVSCGAKHSLYNIACALLDAGDEVVIPAPYWVSYPDQVLLNGAEPVIAETDEKNSFMMTPEILESCVTEKTKAIILNSPSNPTLYQMKSTRNSSTTGLSMSVLLP